MRERKRQRQSKEIEREERGHHDTKGRQEQCRQKNSYAKILNKVLARQIQQHVSVIMHHDQLEFISWIQVWSNTIE